MRSLIHPRLLRRLLPPGTRVVVATSGGADSQALLHVLATARKRLEIDVDAIGIDHALRPAATSELDSAETLCKTLGIAFTRTTVEVPRTGNLMAQARTVRHRALKSHVKSMGADRLALGHTATDVAETVLMNLSRGSSLRGAGAMPAKRGQLIRPLIDCTREETRAYCVAHDIPFADDPTNHDLSFKRPLLRHAVLPALRAVSPAADRAIAQFAREARLAERSLSRQARDFLNRHRVLHGPWAEAPVALPVARLLDVDLALRTRVVRGMLQSAGVKATRRRIHRVLGALGTPGFSMRSGSARIGVDREHLFVLRDIPYEAVVEDGWKLPPWGVQFSVHDTPGNFSGIPEESRGVAFDADALHHPLLVRPWTRGDVIRCFGHGGRAKVGDLFTNQKIPRPLREAWPLVTHNDEVVWVVGLKRAAFAPVTEATRRMKVIELDAALIGSAH